MSYNVSTDRNSSSFTSVYFQSNPPVEECPSTLTLYPYFVYNEHQIVDHEDNKISVSNNTVFKCTFIPEGTVLRLYWSTTRHSWIFSTLDYDDILDQQGKNVRHIVRRLLKSLRRFDALYSVLSKSKIYTFILSFSNEYHPVTFSYEQPHLYIFSIQSKDGTVEEDTVYFRATCPFVLSLHEASCTLSDALYNSHTNTYDPVYVHVDGLGCFVNKEYIENVYTRTGFYITPTLHPPYEKCLLERYMEVRSLPTRLDYLVQLYPSAIVDFDLVETILIKLLMDTYDHKTYSRYDVHADLETIRLRHGSNVNCLRQFIMNVDDDMSPVYMFDVVKSRLPNSVKQRYAQLD